MISVLAALLLLAAVAMLWARLPRLGLLDCFICSIAAYFGAYTIVDVWANNPGDLDPLAVWTMYGILGVALTLLWSAARTQTTSSPTSLATFRADCDACRGWPIILLLGITYAYRLSTPSFFSDVAPGAIGDEDLPYWFTSLGMLSSLTIFPATFVSVSKARRARGVQRLFWFGMAAFGALAILGMGRRAIFAFLVVVGWDVLDRARAAGKSWVAVIVVITALPLLVTISNIFQTYRLVSHRGVILENQLDLLDVESFSEAASDINRTIDNLGERMALWRFNYEIANADLDGKAQFQYGSLFLRSVQNFVPGVINPNKVIFDSEKELVLAFGIGLDDMPDNIFASMYGDFGLWSALLIPMAIFGLVGICRATLRRLEDPFLRVLLTGTAIFYLLNMEGTYVEPVGLTRDYILVSAFYLIARAVARWLEDLAESHALREGVARSA